MLIEMLAKIEHVRRSPPSAERTRLLGIPPRCRVQTGAGTDHQSVYIGSASLMSALGI
jgi:hypothetical protein